MADVTDGGLLSKTGEFVLSGVFGFVLGWLGERVRLGERVTAIESALFGVKGNENAGLVRSVERMNDQLSEIRSLMEQALRREGPRG